MTTQFRKLYTSLRDDEDWRARSPAAKLVYAVGILADPQLSHVGGATLSERRLAGDTGLTVGEVTAALEELAATRYLLIDWDAGCLVIRTFARHDQVDASWSMTAAAWKAWGRLSPRLRDEVLAHLPAGMWTHAKAPAPPEAIVAARRAGLDIPTPPEPTQQSMPFDTTTEDHECPVDVDRDADTEPATSGPDGTGNGPDTAREGPCEGPWQGPSEGPSHQPSTFNPQPPTRASGAAQPTTTVATAPPAPGRARSQEPAGFGDWWAAYPRKIDRHQAAGAYRRAVASGAEPGEILAGLRSWSTWWATDGTAERFIPYPTRWLNARTWTASPPAAGIAVPAPTGPTPATTVTATGEWAQSAPAGWRDPLDDADAARARAVIAAAKQDRHR